MNISVSLPYRLDDPDNMRFIHKNKNPDWTYVKKNELGENDVVIICRKCDKPAAQLDHYYPYYTDMNLCKNHIFSINKKAK